MYIRRGRIVDTITNHTMKEKVQALSLYCSGSNRWIGFRSPRNHTVCLKVPGGLPDSSSLLSTEIMSIFSSLILLGRLAIVGPYSCAQALESSVEWANWTDVNQGEKTATAAVLEHRIIHSAPAPASVLPKPNRYSRLLSQPFDDCHRNSSKRSFAQQCKYCQTAWVICTQLVWSLYATLLSMVWFLSPVNRITFRPIFIEPGNR